MCLFFPSCNIILQTRQRELQPEARKVTIPDVYFKHVCKNVPAHHPLPVALRELERWLARLCAAVV